jgi:hypothetical protein
MGWAGYVALMGERRNAYRIVMGKPEGTTPLGRHVDGSIILKWILDKLGLYGLGSCGSGRNQWRALVNTVMNLQVP